MANEKHYRVTLVKSKKMSEDAEHDSYLEAASSAIASLAGVEVEIPGPTPANPGEAFQIPHTMGLVPQALSMVDNGDSGGIIYASRDDKLLWTKEMVIARCTVASEVNLTIRLSRRPS